MKKSFGREFSLSIYPEQPADNYWEFKSIDNAIETIKGHLTQLCQESPDGLESIIIHMKAYNLISKVDDLVAS